MSLVPGTRFGSYEVTAQIGVGGMGEVHRARDLKLNREVALKVLPDSFVNDPDRLARFQREAHVLASLNHPNIAAIYGVEESSGVRALVMELVEGPTLAEQIAEGARSGCRAPRSETGEHQGKAGRRRKGAGSRFGEKSIFYVPSAARATVSVPITTRPSVTFGAPVELPLAPKPLLLSPDVRGYGVLRDGRFISIVPASDDATSPVPTEFRVVLNWFEELKRLSPTK